MNDKIKEQPALKPDKIEPQAPPESPPKESPREAPLEDQPDEVVPDQGDTDHPGASPVEINPPLERQVPPEAGVDPGLN